MAHQVKCVFCGEMFDRENPSIEYIKMGTRRYAHKNCASNNQQGQTNLDLLMLLKYCQELFGDNYSELNIKKQADKLVKNNKYTYSGILKSLVWFYDIKGNQINEEYGSSLGIIPYIYNDSYQYYYSIYLANEKNKTKDLKELQTLEVVTITPPKQKEVKKRFFNLGGDETNE
jgi:hypothetical protein